ncbi:unnamed protein product, partial [Allacma fusca]
MDSMLQCVILIFWLTGSFPVKSPFLRSQNFTVTSNYWVLLLCILVSTLASINFVDFILGVASNPFEFQNTAILLVFIAAAFTESVHLAMSRFLGIIFATEIVDLAKNLQLIQRCLEDCNRCWKNVQKKEVSVFEYKRWFYALLVLTTILDSVALFHWWYVVILSLPEYDSYFFKLPPKYKWLTYLCFFEAILNEIISQFCVTGFVVCFAIWFLSIFKEFCRVLNQKLLKQRRYPILIAKDEDLTLSLTLMFFKIRKCFKIYDKVIGVFALLSLVYSAPLIGFSIYSAIFNRNNSTICEL